MHVKEGEREKNGDERRERGQERDDLNRHKCRHKCSLLTCRKGEKRKRTLC